MSTPALSQEGLHGNTISEPSLEFGVRAVRSGSSFFSLVRLLDVAAIGGAIMFYAVFIYRSRFTVDGAVFFSLFDDAMISMRYARNLAEGNGLVWNPGQPAVEGYSNPLWTIWMAVLHLLPVPESKMALLVMISGAAILIVNLLVVRAITRQILPEFPLAGSIAMLLTGLYYPLIFWTLRGMEVGLLTLIVSLAVLLALRLRADFRRQDLLALGAVMAAGILTRSEAILPCLVVSGFVLLTVQIQHPRRVFVFTSAILGGVVFLQTGFRLLYYGHPFPNTYYLKLQGIDLSDRVDRGRDVLESTLRGHLAVPVLIAAVYLIISLIRKRAHPAVYLLTAIIIVQCAYSVYVGGDAWEGSVQANRYIVPGIPSLFILCALALVGLPTLLSPLSRMRTLGGFATRWQLGAPMLRRRWIHGYAIVAIIVSGLMVVTVNRPSFDEWKEHNALHANDDAVAARYRLALRASTSEDAVIAVVWAGAIPYFSQRTSIDLLGKSDSVVATSPPRPGSFYPGHNKWDYAHSIELLKPDVVAQLWGATKQDRQNLEAWGYEQVEHSIYVRSGSTQVTRRAVEDSLRKVPWIPLAKR
ncbi:hypothetical protein BH23CHL1_BH23CHL1_14060 [soil metagenome]